MTALYECQDCGNVGLLRPSQDDCSACDSVRIAVLKATTAPEAGAVGTTEGREPKIDTTREGADR